MIMTVDTQILFFLNGLAGRSPVLDGIIVFFASYLAYILVIVLIAFLFFSAYSRREKIEIFLVVFASGVIARLGITELIRYFYHRPRPFDALPVHQLFTDTAWSFPSGHATFFFALSMALYFYNKRWGIVFLIATGLITMSRIIAGVHYPSDILGGAAIGVLCAYVSHFFASRMAAKPTD